jgi:uracil-DNA glycosylase family 4
MNKALNEIIDEAIRMVNTFENNPTIKLYRNDLDVSKSEPAENLFDIKNQNEINNSKAEKDNDEWSDSNDLESFSRSISSCPKCKELASTRTQVVFGSGNPDADIMVIGEAPGAEEDKQGKPFVGRAGQLLTKILEAINLKREEVYIANILKCRPPQNRNPEPREIQNCEPYLFRQLDMIKPKLILALGTFASQTLLRTKEPLGRLRGKFHDYQGIKTMVTYHPAALLRNPNWKKYTWEDVKLLRSEYDKMMPGKQPQEGNN